MYFSAYNYWFYVPIVATHIGAILGSVFYDVLIGLHWPPVDDNTSTLERPLTSNAKQESSKS